MSTNYDQPEPFGLALEDHADPAAEAPPSRDEAALREREGLPPDAVILAPAFDPPPMRCPEGVWAMLVVAVDIARGTDGDRAGEVALFAGSWVPEQPPANGPYDGDLVVRLTAPADPDQGPQDNAVDADMLLAHHGHWQQVGHWSGVDNGWPLLVAPTATAVMGRQGDATQDQVKSTPAASPAPPIGNVTRGHLVDLLDAGLITAGEEFVWNRTHYFLRHTVWIRHDGAVVLADGRAFVSPSGAVTALGGKHFSGWKAFRRARDGRSLGDLREELRARRSQ